MFASEIEKIIENNEDAKLHDLLEREIIQPNYKIRNISLLVYAIHVYGKDCIEVIKKLLEFGADANEIDDRSPLLYVTLRLRKYAASLLLLEHGANPDIGYNTATLTTRPLVEAIWVDNPKLILALLINGANPNLPAIVDKLKYYPLIEAAVDGDLKTVELLLQYDADPLIKGNVQNVKEEMNAFDAAKLKGHNAVCEVLKKAMENKPINPIPQLTNFSVALSTALQSNNLEQGEKLLSCLADLKKQADILEKMGIKAPYDLKTIVNTQNEQKQPPLLLAALQGNLKFLESLIQLGANVLVLDDAKRTIIARIIDNLPHELPFETTLKYLQCINYLILQKVNINAIDISNHTVLDLAVSKGNEHVVRTLLINEAKPNQWNDGDPLNTPLHLAILKAISYPEKITLISILLEHQADPLFKPDVKKQSAYEFAISKKANAQIIELLERYMPKVVKKEHPLIQNAIFKPKKNSAIPHAYLCPITYTIMKDPVLCTLDGNSYENSAIRQSLELYKKSPLTNQPLGAHSIDEVLVSNRNLKDSIDEFIKDNPHLFDSDGNELDLEI